MILGIGTDIVNIGRIEKSIKRQELFVDRILTPMETIAFKESPTALKPAFLAKRFAAKEAVSKALGTGIGRGVSFQHIHIEHDDFGKPKVALTDGALQRAESLASNVGLFATKPLTHISISDESEYAIAYCVIETH